MKRKMRKIILAGEINTEMYDRFTRELDELLLLNDKVPVTIELNSMGGYEEDALAIAGRIRNVHVPVHIMAYGQVQSAAVIILASGDKRSADQGTKFMVHEESYELDGSYTTSELIALAERATRSEKTFNDMLTKLTGDVDWDYLSQNETYFTAREALQYKLIDSIHKGAIK